VTTNPVKGTTMTTQTELAVEDIDIEDWIDGVSYLQAKVTIPRNPALYAEYGPLLEQIRNLEATQARKTTPKPDSDDGLDTEPALASRGEESLADEPTPLDAEITAELDRLYEQAETLWKQYEADVEVWQIRRLDEAEVVTIRDSLGGLPPEPAALPQHPSEAHRKRFLAEMDAWMKKMAALRDELNLHCIAAATLSVTVNGETKKPPTLDGVRRVATRPGGTEHIKALAAAVEQLSVTGVEFAAPHRPGA
jgi:hypothetical protein